MDSSIIERVIVSNYFEVNENDMRILDCIRGCYIEDGIISTDVAYNEGIQPECIMIDYTGKYSRFAEWKKFLCDRTSMIILFCEKKSGFNSIDIRKQMFDLGYIEIKRIRGFEKYFETYSVYKLKNPENLVNIYNCTGCGACFSSCHTNSIEMVYDINGFLKPILHKDDCVSCNKCVNVCPSINPQYNNTKPEVFAYKSDDAILKQSTSGGAFSLLSKIAIDNKMIVYGARWKNQKLVIDKFKSMNEIVPFRHSKYVQSDSSVSFKEVRDDLNKGNRVIYFGLPCQIAGLKKVIGDDNNLITVDLLCSHTPSLGSFLKYVKEIDMGDFDNIYFRTKKWKDYNHIIEKNGTITEYSYDEGDMFELAFNRGKNPSYTINETCKNCLFSMIPRQGDLSIGDFWKINDYCPEIDSQYGVSIILSNNSKGESLLNFCSNKLIQINDDDVLKFNRINKMSPLNLQPRFYDLLRKKSFKEALEKTIKNQYEIGLVFWWAKNYGTNLTNYALYRFFTEMGKTILCISYPPQKHLVFSLFSKNPIKEYEESNYILKKTIELESLNNNCDVFILGSDQVFRPNFIKQCNFFTTLNWVNSEKKKISYAASFGDMVFDNNIDKITTEFYLSRFNSISVREKNAVELMADNYHIKSDLVVDPVFLVDKSDWEAFTSPYLITKGNFIGVYLLDEEEEKDNILKEVQTVTSTEICVIRDAGKKTIGYSKQYLIDNATIEVWLSLIRYSELFITDSFHGLCFALIFRKPFIVFYTDKQTRGKGRFESLLSQIGLKDRWIGSYAEVGKALQVPINWDNVWNKLESAIDDSKLWIQKNLDEEASNKTDLYDLLYQFEDNSKKINKEIIERIHNLEVLANLLNSFIPDYWTSIIKSINSVKKLPELLNVLEMNRSSLTVFISSNSNQKVNWSELLSSTNLGISNESVFISILTSELTINKNGFTSEQYCDGLSEYSITNDYEFTKKTCFVIKGKNIIINKPGICIFTVLGGTLIDVSYVEINKKLDIQHIEYHRILMEGIDQ